MCVHSFSFMRAGTLKCLPGLKSFDLLSFSFIIQGISLEKYVYCLSHQPLPRVATHTPHIAMSAQGMGVMLAPAHTGLQPHEPAWETQALWVWGGTVSHLLQHREPSAPWANPEVGPLSPSEYPCCFGWSVFTAKKCKYPYLVPGPIGTLWK